MDETYTPGPWHVDDEMTEIRNGNGNPICRMGQYGEFKAFDNFYNCEANARLIEAAPELLEACRPIVEWAEKYNPPDDPTVVIELTRDEYNALTSAIAKAI